MCKNETKANHVNKSITFLHCCHVDCLKKKKSLLCGEKYYTDLFLEESPTPAGLIQPPSVQTSWEIDFWPAGGRGRLRTTWNKNGIIFHDFECRTDTFLDTKRAAEIRWEWHANPSTDYLQDRVWMLSSDLLLCVSKFCECWTVLWGINPEVSEVKINISVCASFFLYSLPLQVRCHTLGHFTWLFHWQLACLAWLLEVRTEYCTTLY